MNPDIFHGFNHSNASKTGYSKMNMPVKIINSSTLLLNLARHQWTILENKNRYEAPLMSRVHVKR